MTEIAKTWSGLKAEVASRHLALQFVEDGEVVHPFAIDGALAFGATIYKGAVPDGVLPVYSQEQNDADLAEFDSAYRNAANKTIDPRPALEPDNRMVVVNFPADEGSFMWLCGRGDDIDNGLRGLGQKIAVTFADTQRGGVPESKHVDIQFLEQVQLHDGRLYVKTPAEWGLDDEWNFGVFMPATPVTPNANNTGNCNVVAGYVVVPAAGDGAYDVDLEAATPVPASGDGFWSYDQFSDALSPSASPGSAGWHLLLVDVESYFMRSMPIPFDPHGVFDFDAYKAERVSPRWALRLAVAKASDGPGTLAGWIVTFRENTT